MLHFRVQFITYINNLVNSNMHAHTRTGYSYRDAHTLRSDLFLNRAISMKSVTVTIAICPILNHISISIQFVTVKFHLLLLRNRLLAYYFRQALEAGSLEP